MNSIVFTHVTAPAEGVSLLDLALDRLSAWLDAEQETLGRVLAQAGRRQATGALEALVQLHLGPNATSEDLRDLLEEALTSLEVLLATVRGIPSRCQLETAWGLPGPDAFETHIRWSGARLEDILATLVYALEA